MENWVLIELVCLGIHFSYCRKGAGSRFSHHTKGWHCSRASSFSQYTICSSSDIKLSSSACSRRVLDSSDDQPWQLIISSSCCETLPCIPSALSTVVLGFSSGSSLGISKTSRVVIFMCVCWMGETDSNGLWTIWGFLFKKTQSPLLPTLVTRLNKVLVPLCSQGEWWADWMAGTNRGASSGRCSVTYFSAVTTEVLSWTSALFQVCPVPAKRKVDHISPVLPPRFFCPPLKTGESNRWRRPGNPHWCTCWQECLTSLKNISCLGFMAGGCMLGHTPC